MDWLKYSQELSQGKTVQFRPKGNSMNPRIKSGQLVTVQSMAKYEKDDIVFCKVNGNFYVHKIVAVQEDRYQISNNHGHINGWTSKVFGKVIRIEE